MREKREHTTIRTALVFAIVYVLVWGGIPAPALAEMVEGGTAPSVAAEAGASQGAATNDVGGSGDGEPKAVAETVSQKVTVPASASGLVYDGTEQVGVSEGEGFTLAGNTATDAGDYTATATLKDGYAWDDGSTDSKEISWSIARRPVTVTADGKTKTAGEADPELTATFNGLVGDDKVVFDISREAGEEPGEYEITPSGDAEQGNYAVTFVSGKLAIGEAPKPALTAQADGDLIASGTWGTCPWEITEEGVLMVFSGEGASPSPSAYANYWNGSPWIQYAESIRSVVFSAKGDDKVILPSDSSGLLCGLYAAASMDLSGADTSHVTDMRGMFTSCSSLSNLDVSGWDTSKVEFMGGGSPQEDYTAGMFTYCSSLTALDLSEWNTSAVTNLRGMFRGCSSLTTLDLSRWNTSEVTDMRGMFDSCSRLSTLDISDWDTSKVECMGGYSDSAYELQAEGMFYECSSLTSIDISDWNTSAVTNMRSMFAGCSSLSVLDVSGWDTSSVVDMRNMFHNCSRISTLDVSKWNTSKVKYMGFSRYAGGSDYGEGMFSGCSRLTTLDLSKWDTSCATDMGYMFYGCSRLTTIELSDWDTSGVTDMLGMFSGCSRLITLDISGWNTSSVTDVRSMFEGCSRLLTLDVSDWDTSKVEYFGGYNSIWGGMFRDCSSLSSLDVSGWDTSSALNMGNVFEGCSHLTTLDLSEWNTSNVTDIRGMFRNCSSLSSLNVSTWNTSKVVSLAETFSGCSSLLTLDLAAWDTSDVTDISGQFGGSTQGMQSMFYGCSSLSSLDISAWDTSGVTDMSFMFYGCSSLKSLDLSDWETSNVTRMDYMFSNCSKLAMLDISGWDTSSAACMSRMFQGCTSLVSLDVSEWDTCVVTDMDEVFRDCSKLASLDLSSWDTSLIEFLYPMFSGCSGLNSIKIGTNYPLKNEYAFPDATASNGKWWSVKDQVWYTKDQIVASRSGITDTYTSYETFQKTDISGAIVSFVTSSYTYNGTEQKPMPTVTLDGLQLKAGIDFACSYKKNRNVGTAKVTVTGIGAYEGTAPGSFEITKAPLTVRPKGCEAAYGDEPEELEIEYDGLVGTDTASSLVGSASLSCERTQFSPVGDYPITFSEAALSSDNYEVSYQPGVLKVKPRPVTLAWSDASFTYDGKPHCPTVAVGNAVNGDVVAATVEGAQTNAGTHTATAKSLSNANYCLPEGRTCEFTIAKAAISPTVSLAGWTYGEPASTPSVAGNPGGGEVSYRYGRAGSPVVEHTDTVPTEVGTYVVRAIVAETGNYLGGEAATQFTVSKAASSVTTLPSARELTYTGSSQALVTAGIASGGAMRYSADGGATWSADVPEATDAGGYRVLYKVVGDANHEDVAAAGPIAVTIARAGNTLEVGDGQTVEVGSELDLSAFITGAIGGVTYAVSAPLDGCSVDESSGLFTAGTVAGTCVVSVSAAGDGNHESATKILSVTVLPSVKDATVSFQNQADASVEYDGTAKTPAVTVVHGGQTLTADDYLVEYLNNTNAGTATVRITGKGNFAGTQEKTFTINRRAATVTARDASKAYGTKDPTLSANVTGTVNGDTLSYTVARDSGEGLGEYAIKPSGKTEQGNYVVTYQNGTFTISQNSVANAQATFARQTYTGKALTPTPTSVVVGGRLLVAGVDYEVGTYANNTNAGTATVVIVGKGGYAGTKGATFRIEPATITSVSVSPSSYSYDGKAKTPAVTVKAGGATVPASGYSVSYANNTNPGTATVTVTGKGNYTGSRSATFRIDTSVAHVAYRTHVQSFGWQPYVRDGAMSGTSGKAKRLEGINIKLEGAHLPGSIEYRTHVQKIGWQGYMRDGAMSGTSGRALRLEAIQIRLTGQMAERYDVWYRVHAQTYGWMGWAKNDSPAGTAGYAKRLEGIEIRVLPKGSAAPGSQSGAFVTKDGSSPAQSYTGHQVSYRTHVQSFGWRSYVCDGQMSGTTGLAKRLEGINIKLINQQVPGSIEYRTHVQSYGWMPYVCDGAMSGTSGQAKRLEAIQIRLTGQMAQRYDVWYRVHAQTFGWMGWAKNDQQAGTAGWAKRLECLEIVVLPKGSPAPGSTANAFRRR